MPGPHRSARAARHEILSGVTALATSADAASVRSTIAFVTAHGEESVARVLQEIGRRPAGRDWSMTVATAAALADAPSIERLLVDDGADAAQAQEVAVSLSLLGGALLLAAVETDRRVGLSDETPGGWALALGAAMQEPWGPVTGNALDLATSDLDDRARRAVEEFRHLCQRRAIQKERMAVASEMRRVVKESGLSQRAFARKIGTSPSRLSTYLSGRVVPSATLMLRAQRLQRHLRIKAARGGTVARQRAS